MLRLLGLLMTGTLLVASSGCVGPMGAGCCGSLHGSCDSCVSSPSCNGCSGCGGELYVDPWINHPADCVDPCDSCGNYNGQSCGKCRPILSGARNLWGYYCGCDPGPVATTNRSFAPRKRLACSGCDSGCDSCVVEPACGCEGACDCDMIEPGCGLEPGCGIEVVEPGCGLEPGCGFEASCGCEGGCSCGGVVAAPADVFHASPPPEMPRALPQPPAEQAYAPHRTRKIFNPRTESARSNSGPRFR